MAMMYVDVMELMVARLSAIALIGGMMLWLMVNDCLMMGLVTTKIMMFLRLLMMLLVVMFMMFLSSMVLNDKTMTMMLLGFGVNQL